VGKIKHNAKYWAKVKTPLINRASKTYGCVFLFKLTNQTVFGTVIEHKLLLKEGVFMKDNFTISWKGSRVVVDLVETNKTPVYVLHMPKAKKEIISHIDETGVEHWLERGKGETDDSVKIGALIEMAMYKHYNHWGI